jgi:hypothetical protein
LSYEGGKLVFAPIRLLLQRDQPFHPWPIPPMHQLSPMPSAFSLLKGGALASRVGFEAKNRCQHARNCQALDGSAESQLNSTVSRIRKLESTCATNALGKFLRNHPSPNLN